MFVGVGYGTKDSFDSERWGQYVCVSPLYIFNFSLIIGGFKNSVKKL